MINGELDAAGSNPNLPSNIGVAIPRMPLMATTVTPLNATTHPTGAPPWSAPGPQITRLMVRPSISETPSSLSTSRNTSP